MCGADYGDRDESFLQSLHRIKHVFHPHRVDGSSEFISRTQTMNEDTLKGNWKQFKEKFNEKRGK